ncbi:MAG: hypothetical protein HC840_24900 [Leptolyngbyaceae cyanobacterium RM2_2_4]|nr:hypothetical protein [Leptolyngbyaceae cyanobacterium RM2_2_4]
MREVDRKKRHNNPVGADVQGLSVYVLVLLPPLNRTVMPPQFSVGTHFKAIGEVSTARA